MEYREFGFKSSTGKELVACAWEVEYGQNGKEPKGKLILVHGLGEHIGRYQEMAEYFTEQGYNVYGFDLPGFGQSPGLRGHVRSFDDYLQDLRRFVLIHKGSWQQQKTFLVGHSMGGLISLAFGVNFPGLIDGLIVSSPALKVYPIPKLLSSIIALCNRLVPWLSFSNRLSVEMLARNPQVGKKYREDPLTHDRITPRLFSEMQYWMKYILDHPEELQDLMLLMYAGQDQIVDPAGARQLAELLADDSDTEVICFDDMYHEIWNETERELVWLQTLRWVEEFLD